MKLYDVLSAIIEAKKKPAETPIEQDEKFKESLAAAKMELGNSPKEKKYKQAVEALVTLYLTGVDRPHQLADRDAQATRVRDYITSWFQQNGVVPKESKKTGDENRQKNKSTKTAQAVDTPDDTTLVEPQPADSAEPQAAEVPADVPSDTPSTTVPATEPPAAAGTSAPVEPPEAEPESSKLSKPVTKKPNAQSRPISRKQQLAASGDLLSYAIDQVEKNKDQLGSGTSTEELQQSIIKTAKTMLKNKYKMTPDQIEQMITSSGIVDQIEKSIAGITTGATKTSDASDDSNTSDTSDTPDTLPADATSSDTNAQNTTLSPSTTDPKGGEGEPAAPEVKPPTPPASRAPNPRASRRPAGTSSVPVTTGTPAAAPVASPANTTVPPSPSVSTDTKDRLQKLAGVGVKPSPQPKPDTVPSAAMVGSEPTTKADPTRLQKLAGIDTTQTTEPAPEIKPWTQAWIDMRRQQLAKMDPEQRLATKDRAMRMVGHEPTDTPVDLIKGLKKYAQAPRGSMVQRTGGYRSMFREMKEYLEAQGLLHEELTLDEFMQLMTETTYGQTILNELEQSMAGKFTNERIELDYEDDEQPTKEPVKIPTGGLARKGDGLGCRDHVNCRHNHSANDGEHSRTVKKKVRRRAAKQEHPRNLDELSTDTLKKYIKAAANDASDRAFKSGIKYAKADEKHQTPELAVSDKENKRHKGIGRAIKKLKETTITENTMENSYTLEEWMGKMQEAGIATEEVSLEDMLKHLRGQDKAGVQVPTSVRLQQILTPKKPAEPSKQTVKKEEVAEESYTLEEWMGMVQEAGINLDELKWHNSNEEETTDMGQLGSFDYKQAGYDAGDSYQDDQDEPHVSMEDEDLPMEESYTLEEWMGMLEELGIEETSDVMHSPLETNPEDSESGEAELSTTATHRAPVQLPPSPKDPTLYQPDEEPVDTPMSRELRAQHPPVKIEETLNENTFASRMQVLAGILPQS